MFRPDPELADIFMSLDRLVPELEAVLGAILAQPPDVDGTGLDQPLPPVLSAN
jgi:hypothetical protein